MELKVLEKSKTKLKLEVIGEDHTLCNALRKELWNDDNVKVSGYNLPHSIVGNPTLVVEAADAKKALMDAVKRLKKNNSEFLEQFKKAAK